MESLSSLEFGNNCVPSSHNDYQKHMKPKNKNKRYTKPRNNIFDPETKASLEPYQSGTTSFAQAVSKFQ